MPASLGGARGSRPGRPRVRNSALVHDVSTVAVSEGGCAAPMGGPYPTGMWRTRSTRWHSQSGPDRGHNWILVPKGEGLSGNLGEGEEGRAGAGSGPPPRPFRG